MIRNLPHLQKKKKGLSQLLKRTLLKVHQKLGFTDSALAENHDIANNIATTDLFYLVIAETSIKCITNQRAFLDVFPHQ